jgi:hypothetical protein
MNFSSKRLTFGAMTISGVETSRNSVLAISQDDRTVDIKKRGDTAGTHPEAVFVHNSVNTKVLAESLLRLGGYVADNGVEGNGNHPAARERTALFMVSGSWLPQCV